MVGVELGVMDWRGRNRDEVGETTCIVGHVRAFEEEVANARDQRVNKLEPAVLNCCHLEGSRNAPTRRRLRHFQE